VIRAKKRYKYFASQSAVPTFKNIVRILVEQDKLKPDPEVIAKMQEDDIYKSETSTHTPVKPSQNTVIKKEHKKKPKTKPKYKEKSVPMPQMAPPKYTPPPMPDDVEDLF